MAIKNCGTERHLVESGLQLAVYTLVGRLTSGGKQPYYANHSSIAIYIYNDCSRSHVNTIQMMFRKLRAKGWLEQRGGEIWYVSHDVWAGSHPGQCADPDYWTNHKDALRNGLTELFDGALPINGGMLSAARRVATDAEFMAAIAEIPRDGQSPTNIFWRTVKRLQRAELVGTPKL